MSDYVPLALIVEDTEDIANMVKAFLKSMGIAVFHANNGLEALDFLEQQTPDFMILDIGLPMMSGWDLLETLKGKYQEIVFPVIVLTAFGDPTNRMIGRLQTSVIRYMVKPFDPNELMALVRELLSAS